ncbi:polysaccharide deacetylase family protein [candidate division KSB1 bacterium]|nr:polysaccharide deacetylase family protein [candidate division KSB1 bacterium]
MLSTITSAQTIAERLGYAKTDRLLIINADDFGMCHAENVATMELLEKKVITSATAMVPCPWFKEAADFCQTHPDADVGIHLTLTNEWKRYKWGPVASKNSVPSLITENGFFPPDCKTVEISADTGQVRLELQAQIERAIKMGITPTHLDNHMGSVYGLETGRDFLEIIFDLCVAYRLPFRLPINISDELKQALPPGVAEQFALRTQQAQARGVVVIDYLISTKMKKPYEAFKAGVIDQLKALKPGITEMYIHTALPTDEMKAISNAWQHREFEYRIFQDPEVQKIIRDEKIKLIGWRDLMLLQRKTQP